jgi:hypothetical protein
MIDACNYKIREGSSLDIIDRSLKFLQCAPNFLYVLDYMDNEETYEYQELLTKLEKRALQAINKESDSL